MNLNLKNIVFPEYRGDKKELDYKSNFDYKIHSLDFDNMKILIDTKNNTINIKIKL